MLGLNKQFRIQRLLLSEDLQNLVAITGKNISKIKKLAASGHKHKKNTNSPGDRACLNLDRELLP